MADFVSPFAIQTAAFPSDDEMSKATGPLSVDALTEFLPAHSMPATISRTISRCGSTRWRFAVPFSLFSFPFEDLSLLPCSKSCQSCQEEHRENAALLGLDRWPQSFNRFREFFPASMKIWAPESPVSVCCPNIELQGNSPSESCRMSQLFQAAHEPQYTKQSAHHITCIQAGPGTCVFNRQRVLRGRRA